MTRPNELQQLDEDLAAGRLSAENHRRRRDELVRAATKTPQTTGAPQAASPFPPAFRWETSPLEVPEAATQVMQAVGRNTGGGDPTEAIPAVHTVAAEDPVRRPVAPTNLSYQQDSSQVRGLFQPVDSLPDHSATDHSAPPWADSDLPPIAEQQNAWMRQGPEVFEAPASQHWTKQIIGIAVLAVLVVGLAGAGVAYVLSAGSVPNQASSAPPAPSQPVQSEPTTAARQLPAPPAPRPAPADAPQALIEPPGEARGGGGLFDLPRLERTDLLPQPILTALRAGAMTDGVLKTTTDDGNTIGLFAFTLADEQAATDVVNTIATVQRDGGLKIDGSRAQQGLTVLGAAPGSRSTVYRGVYVLYNRAIFLEVFGPDYDAVLSAFDSVVAQQLVYAPPTVRGR